MEALLARILEKVENRYYGKYRGFVEDNADPEKRGRLLLRIPSVLGPNVISGWALPCAPYGGAPDQGFFFIPEKGAGVWVEFEAGDLDYPIWVGTFWSKPGGASEVPKPADTQQPPTSKIIKTFNYTIEITDDKGSESIKVTDGNKNAMTMDSSGVTIKSSRINIGDGASEPLVLGNQLKTALENWVNAVFKAHTHTGNLGAPTSPPLPGSELVLNPALSSSNYVK